MNLKCLNLQYVDVGAKILFKDSNNTIHLSLHVHVQSMKTYADGYIQLMR